MTKPLRALFINENIGGHATMHLGIAEELERRSDITAQIRSVPRATGFRRVVSARVPGLARLDADLQALRAQLAQSVLVRRRLLADVHDFDVVHLYTQNVGLISQSILRSMPSVVSLDSTTVQNAFTLPQRSPGVFTPLAVRAARPFEASVYRSSTLVVAQSYWCAASLREDFGVDPDKLSVIPFGITPPPSLPRRLASPPRIVFVGTSMSRKGGWDLVDVWRHELSGRCELHLVTREHVDPEPGLVVHNDFIPGDARLPELLSTAHAMVFPSVIDKSSYAVLEALGAGVPVVAYEDANGTPELIRHKETGLLAPRDRGALVSAIDTLISDDEESLRLGRAAREDVLTRFSASRTTEQLVDVLHRAVEVFQRNQLSPTGARRG